MKRDLSTTSSISSLLHPQKLAGPKRAAECQWRAPIGLRCPQLFTAVLGRNLLFFCHTGSADPSILLH